MSRSSEARAPLERSRSRGGASVGWAERSRSRDSDVGEAESSSDPTHAHLRTIGLPTPSDDVSTAGSDVGARARGVRAADDVTLIRTELGKLRDEVRDTHEAVHEVLDLLLDLRGWLWVLGLVPPR